MERKEKDNKDNIMQNPTNDSRTISHTDNPTISLMTSPATKPAKKRKELRCCLGCGRDTRHDYCSRCIGRGSHSGPRDARRVLRGRDGRYLCWPTQVDMPLEDDYSDASDADSVCEDNSASTSRFSFGS